MIIDIIIVQFFGTSSRVNGNSPILSCLGETLCKSRRESLPRNPRLTNVSSSGNDTRAVCAILKLTFDRLRHATYRAIPFLDKVRLSVQKAAGRVSTKDCTFLAGVIEYVREYQNSSCTKVGIHFPSISSTKRCMKGLMTSIRDVLYLFDQNNGLVH
jgi:hypothetical protein